MKVHLDFSQTLAPLKNTWFMVCYPKSDVLINTTYTISHSQPHINAVLHAWNCGGFPAATTIRHNTFSSTDSTTKAGGWMTGTENHLHKLKAWLDIIGLLIKHPLTIRGWLDVRREEGSRGGRGRHACTSFGGACWSGYILLHHSVRIKVDLEALKQSI